MDRYAMDHTQRGLYTMLDHTQTDSRNVNDVHVLSLD